MIMQNASPQLSMAVDLVWYGLYFGVLGRDAAEVASTLMAKTLSRNMNARINDCGVCGLELKDLSHLGVEVCMVCEVNN